MTVTSRHQALAKAPAEGRGRRAGIGARWLLGGLAVVAGCRGQAAAPVAAPTSAPAPTAAAVPAAAPAAALAAPALLCSADGALVLVAPVGGPRQALKPAPPAALVGLAHAGERIVGVSQDAVYLLDSAPTGGHWTVLTALGQDGGPRPLRAISQPGRAVVWLRGNDPGTFKGALAIDSQGVLTRHDTATALARFGPPWAVGNLPNPAAGSTELPAALRPLVEHTSPAGHPAVTRALLDQRLPSWSGRLVAPDLGASGDWPEAPLYYLPDAAGTAPTALTYKGSPLMFRGLLDSGPAGELLFDGSFSAAQGGLLLIPPLAHDPPRRLEGLDAPCVFLSSASPPAGLSVTTAN